MRVSLLVWAAVLCGCHYGGAQSFYGRSANEMNFGEVDMVLMSADGDRLQGIPFFAAGQGMLPGRYDPDGEHFERYSLGTKLRYPFAFRDGRFIVYVEAGGMMSFYAAEAIGSPFVPELVAGVGAQFGLGTGWWFDLGARARHPAGNGNNHDEPEHAPHGTKPEFVFGVKKDF
jgi:hypothetical protein